jgi:ATP-dependent DNA helicase DinG
MELNSASKPNMNVKLPAISSMVVNARHALLLSEDGELTKLAHIHAQVAIHNKPILVCNAPYTSKRLGKRDIFSFDVLELFAFVYPAEFCVPTPKGLAQKLNLPIPKTQEDEPFSLFEVTKALLLDLKQNTKDKETLLDIAAAMSKKSNIWSWTPYIYSALDKTFIPDEHINVQAHIKIIKNLTEWSEQAPTPQASHYAVEKDECLQRLQKILGSNAEPREQQQEYAKNILTAFQPMDEKESPHIVLAEAGTGTGKTKAYLAPSSVWAEKNEGAVWVSTFTKNLQRQILRELKSVYPMDEVRDVKVALRKGRENYLCLLNLEEAIRRSILSKDNKALIAAGLLTRWIMTTKDGDLVGGDLPGWLISLLGYKNTLGLSDQRGECIYSACDHYHKCFVEKAIRKASRADIVVANHALVMVKAAISHQDDPMPSRYVFDEGHHLFEAADSAFSGHLTARETSDLKRWIIGNEGHHKKSRKRGLRARVEDLIAGDPEAEELLQDIIHTAHTLPSYGWSRRLKDSSPNGTAEEFFFAIFHQVQARAEGVQGPYSLETETYPITDDVKKYGKRLHKRLKDLRSPMVKFRSLLKSRLDTQADTLSSDSRKRIETLISSIDRRTENTLCGWIDMLENLINEQTNEEFIDWFEIERIDGHAMDLGMYRYWIDPMIPFSKIMKPYVHGMIITSATLRSNIDDQEHNWDLAKRRTGVDYLTEQSSHFSYASPFNYRENTQVIILNDVNKNDLLSVSSAYRELFIASKGGALGIFTAIQRLKAVYEKISIPLESEGLHLYAQHIDEIDPATLVDIFRDDIHTCLLGTDAMRDGVDVPGDALRLIVYDRVPWPRPTILHKARKKEFGGREYDEFITRLKVRQAFGRLIRQNTDRGIFVLLDSAMPSRLYNAFPEDTPISKIGLAEAIKMINDFYEEKP